VRLTRPEVGDGPDGRVPPVSGWSKKKKGRSGAGTAGGEAGPTGPVRAREKEEKKKRKGPAGLVWLRAKKRRKGERDGPAGEKKKRGRGKRVFLFLLNFLFKFIFQTFKLKSNRIHAFKS
jgi:hypothetical protein